MSESSTPSRVVLITGCSSGIGEATARHLAERGWMVYATARNVADVAALARAGCRTMALDVTDEASMTAVVGHIERTHGAVGALVNNAGYSMSGAIEAVPLDRVRAQFETNVFGLLRLTQLVLPGMRRVRAGRIVNLSSMGGRLVFPGGGVYHATKYAVEALSDALRFEVRGFGIGVILIEPGLIRTKFADTAVTSMQGAADDVYTEFHARVRQATRDSYERGLASKLTGTADDVARTIEKALTAARPRPRYLVASSAHLFVNQRRWFGDRAWDRFLRGFYPSPGERK